MPPLQTKFISYFSCLTYLLHLKLISPISRTLPSHHCITSYYVTQDYVLSYHDISYDIISYHVITYHTTSCHITSCQSVLYRIKLYHTTYLITSFPSLSPSPSPHSSPFICRCPLRRPIRSILSGQIAKLVLIQLQFVKKELLEAMQAIDELFNANQVSEWTQSLARPLPFFLPLSLSHNLSLFHTLLLFTEFCSPLGQSSAASRHPGYSLPLLRAGFVSHSHIGCQELV